MQREKEKGISTLLSSSQPPQPPTTHRRSYEVSRKNAQAKQFKNARGRAGGSRTHTKHPNEGPETEIQDPFLFLRFLASRTPYSYSVSICHGPREEKGTHLPRLCYLFSILLGGKLTLNILTRINNHTDHGDSVCHSTAPTNRDRQKEIASAAPPSNIVLDHSLGVFSVFEASPRSGDGLDDEMPCLMRETKIHSGSLIFERGTDPP